MASVAVTFNLSHTSCWVCGADVLTGDNFCRSCGTQLTSLARGTAARRARTERRTSLGVFLICIGAIVGTFSYLMEVIPMVAFGLASFLIGVMALYLPESGSIANMVATDLCLPVLATIENLLSDLDLDEAGVYIPASGLGVSPRVFVPLVSTPATKRPLSTLPETYGIFVTAGKSPEEIGVLLHAPGSGILAALERSLHVDLAKVKLEDLKASLDSGFKMLGIANVTEFERHDSTVKIEMKLTSLIELEAKIRDQAPRLSRSVGTPIVSAMAASVSKATGSCATIDSAVVDPSERKIKITIQLSA